MVPLYILGLLLRFGPQHGYQIKKMIQEQLADFTQIKLPTIYYHLERLESSGFVSAQMDQEGSRPEKTVYSISEKGIENFNMLLSEELNMHYRPMFDVDAVFYFSDYVTQQELLDGLSKHIENLTSSLARITEHRAKTIPYMPEAMQPFADIIFEHHAAHYQAEMKWAKKSIQTIKGGY